MRYFAYGSNMCVGRLRHRVPSTKFVCIKLTEHIFRFHKRSIDGSAKANALLTGNRQDLIFPVGSINTWWKMGTSES
jgi:gamma-glutamylcyclotransferase